MRTHARIKDKSTPSIKGSYSYTLALWCFCFGIVPYVTYQLFLTHRSIQFSKEAIANKEQPNFPNRLLDPLRQTNQAITKAVLRKIKRASVHIYGNTYTLSFSGSGVIIDKQRGWVLTNKHVVEERIGYQVMVNTNPRESAKANVIYIDPHYDLAILEVPGLHKFANLEAVTYARQPYVVKNLQAISFGYGHGEPAFHQYRVKETATISLIVKNNNLPINGSMGLVNAYIGNCQPGQSGSGMFTMDGDLIGLMVATSQHVNILQAGVIPIDQIRYVIDFFYKRYQPGKPFVVDSSGIHVGQIPLHCMGELEETKLSLAKSWLQKHIATNGVQSSHSLNALTVISSKQENLCFLDVILEVNGTFVDSIASFYATLQQEKGDSVQLKILRGNYLMNITVAKRLPKK